MTSLRLRAAAAVILLSLGVSAAALAQASARGEVPYPAGYRRWVHIKSGWIGEGNPAFPRFAGLHHVYANAQAMAGYRARTFPVGSVMVFDVLATKPGPGSLTTAERRILDVMEKTADGWRYTEFNGDSHTERTVTAAAGAKACAGCHAASNPDSVFSKLGDADR